MTKIISFLSKMWLKVINLEQSLFPELQASLGTLSTKEETYRTQGMMQILLENIQNS